MAQVTESLSPTHKTGLSSSQLWPRPGHCIQLGSEPKGRGPPSVKKQAKNLPKVAHCLQQYKIPNTCVQDVATLNHTIISFPAIFYHTFKNSSSTKLKQVTLLSTL